MPLKVQLPLPTIGLELYQLEVQTRAKNCSIEPNQDGTILFIYFLKQGFQLFQLWSRTARYFLQFAELLVTLCDVT